MASCGSWGQQDATFGHADGAENHAMGGVHAMGGMDAMGGATDGFAQDGGDCGDCVQLKVSTKKVTVPCTRNTYKQYTVKIPRTVREKIPRTVQYTDMEKRTKQVPYTVNRTETRYKQDVQTYQEPVTRTYTQMVPVKSKVPRTIMVDVVKQVPQQRTKVDMVTKTKSVRIPYQVNIPETKYQTIHQRVPVPRTKVVMEDRVRTVYDTQVKTRCVPVTKMVTKSIPVYSVVPRQAQPCPPGTDCEQGVGGGVAMTGAADTSRVETGFEAGVGAEASSGAAFFGGQRMASGAGSSGFAGHTSGMAHQSTSMADGFGHQSTNMAHGFGQSSEEFGTKEMGGFSSHQAINSAGMSHHDVVQGAEL